LPTQLPATAAIESSRSQEVIFIRQPGQGARISSPFIVEGEGDPTFEQNLVVELSDENGSQLALSPTTIQAVIGSRGEFSAELVFAVEYEQPGRVSVYSTDAFIGAVEHLSSVEVVLLPNGQTSIEQAGSELESIAINSPVMGSQSSGGIIEVSGFSSYYFESNLGMILCGGGLGGEDTGAPNELCGGPENVIAVGFATIQSAEIGAAGPFSGELSYSISSPTPARLILYATSPRDGGLLHVDSVVVELIP
jgi:hypothetical protein